MPGWDEAILAIEFQFLIDANLDFNVELTGFEMGDVDRILGVAGAGDEETVELPDPERPVVTELGDLWSIGGHRIYCGDSRNQTEAIRDSLLHVSGLLNGTMGGPELDFDDDAPTLRRSLYYRHAPEKVMPFLMAFDAAGPTECYRRATTVVPQQAMALVNSRLSARAAEAVAKSVTSTEPKEVVQAVYAKLLGRSATEAEVKLCVEFLRTNPPAALVQALFNHADFSTIR